MKTHQVFAIVGGSQEHVLLFESKDFNKAFQKAEYYNRNRRKIPMQRDYLSSWGGVDDIYMTEKTK